MSQFCANSKCKLKATNLCYCCNKNLCQDHLKEHDELNKIEINNLNNDILNINEQLKLFDLNKLINNSRTKLDSWKENCYKIINNYYEEKCQEIEKFSQEKLNQYEKQIDQIQTTMIDLVRNEKTSQKNLDLIKISLNDLSKQINKFNDKGIQMNVHPFLLNNHLITIKDSKPNAFNINSSKLLSVSRTIDCVNGYQSELCNNERFILINLGDNLCLFDRDLILIKQSSWIDECIYDICWSSTLLNFIIITNKKKVYRINEINLNIERIYGIEEKDWLSCTCSDTCLYLTTRELGTNIYQFKLLPLIRPVKQWVPPYSCKSHESIHDIQYNEGTIALIIRQSFGGSVDIELRSSTTLNKLWSLPLDIRSDGLWSKIICRSLQYDEWLIIHSSTSRLFHITSDGKLKNTLEYQSKLFNASMFGSNILVVHLGSKVNFHQL